MMDHYLENVWKHAGAELRKINEYSNAMREGRVAVPNIIDEEDEEWK